MQDWAQLQGVYVFGLLLSYCSLSKQKDEILNSLLRHAATQRVLDFNTRPLSAKAKGKRRDDGKQQILLNNIFVKGEKSSKTQERRLRELAIKRLGNQFPHQQGKMLKDNLRSLYSHQLRIFPPGSAPPHYLLSRDGTSDGSSLACSAIDL